MTIDITRDERADKGIDLWVKNKGIGTLLYTQRFGKTRLGIRVCNMFSTARPTARIIIVVPNDVILEQWNKEIKKTAKYPNNITTITINKLLNAFIPLYGMLVILDEPQKYARSNSKLRIVKGITTNSVFRLGLTGTYPTKDTKEYENLCNALPIIDTITESEAISKGWITPYTEFNVPLQLTAQDRDLYVQYTNYIKDTLNVFRGVSKTFTRVNAHKYNPIELDKLFGSDYKIIQYCFSGYTNSYGEYTPKETVQSIIAELKGWTSSLSTNLPSNREIIQYFSPNALFERAKTFNKVQRQRNKLINECAVKIDAAIHIVETLKNYKVISFSQSRKFAEDFATIYSKKADDIVVYHSTVPTILLRDEKGELLLNKSGKPIKFGKIRQKRNALEGIKTGRYRILSTVDSLNEGLDIPDLAVAIITSGSCSSITDKQRKARVKTIDQLNPDKMSYIFNLYIDDMTNNDGSTIYSRDKRKLEIRQTNSNPIIIPNIRDLANYL